MLYYTIEFTNGPHRLFCRVSFTTIIWKKAPQGTQGKNEIKYLLPSIDNFHFFVISQILNSLVAQDKVIYSFCASFCLIPSPRDLIRAYASRSFLFLSSLINSLPGEHFT